MSGDIEANPAPSVPNRLGPKHGGKLRGANQEVDPRPVTWRTLIEALQCANVQEEATILKRHFICQVPVTIPNAAAGEYTCHAAYSEPVFTPMLHTPVAAKNCIP